MDMPYSQNLWMSGTMKNQVLPEKSDIKEEVIPLVLSMWKGQYFAKRNYSQMKRMIIS